MSVNQEAFQSAGIQSTKIDWIGALKLIAALLMLNFLLSMTSVWPTLAVIPDRRIAPEFIGLLLILTIAGNSQKVIAPRMLTFLAIGYLFLVAGRYMDIVAPSLFGRTVNFYWDLPQLPRLLWVTLCDQPAWLSACAALGAATLIGGLYWITRLCIGVVAAPIASAAQTLWLRLLIALLCLLAAANYAGMPATWPYVSKPVVPVYWGQFKFLWNAWSPKRAEQLLPPSTVINSALEQDSEQLLARLNQRDVSIVFLESYGACLYDNPKMDAAVKPSRDKLEQAIKDSGRSVVSAFYTSPTIGGASDLAHLSVLSGIDLADSRRHDLLLTTERPTLFDVFRKAGYEAWGLYHSVWWDWVERSYYRYDHYVDGPSLDYPGPEIGHWKIPDQYAIARYEQKYPRMPGDKPRLNMFFTISTHFPFNPTPPYQEDWSRLLSQEPYDSEAVSKAWHSETNWFDMIPGYVSTIEYNHRWLSDYFINTQNRSDVYLLIGDHQPTANISGEGSTWDVPVFFVSKDPELLDQFKKMGFSEGLTPAKRESLGKLSDLTQVIVDNFSRKPD